MSGPDERRDPELVALVEEHRAVLERLAEEGWAVSDAAASLLEWYDDSVEEGRP